MIFPGSSLMFIKNRFRKIISIIFIAATALSSFHPSPVSAQGKDGLKHQINSNSGKISFIGPESGHVLPASQALGTSLRPQDPGMALAKRFAPEFGIQNPERDLAEIKKNKSNNGRTSVR